MPAQRYAQIIDLIEDVKPKSIIEIGVWNGKRACWMAEAALKHSPAVHYEGYDLFETASADTDRDELNAKPHNSIHRVSQRLQDFAATQPGFTFKLYRGNTRQVLRPCSADFVYIDGGHSVETIRHDYEMTRDSPVVLFDDYYLPDAEGRCTDLSLYGANQIVDAIEGAKILPSNDPLMGGGIVALALVRRGL